MNLRLLVLAACAAASIGVSPAVAAPITIFDSGGSPLSSTVTADGTGHFAYGRVAVGGGNAAIEYCRVLPAANACTDRRQMTFRAPYGGYDRYGSTAVMRLREERPGSIRDFLALVTTAQGTDTTIQQDSDRPAPDRMYFARSDDNGATWTDLRVVAEQPGAGEDLPAIDQPVTAIRQRGRSGFGESVATLGVWQSRTAPGVWFQSVPVEPGTPMDLRVKVFELGPDGREAPEVALYNLCCPIDSVVAVYKDRTGQIHSRSWYSSRGRWDELPSWSAVTSLGQGFRLSFPPELSGFSGSGVLVYADGNRFNKDVTRYFDSNTGTFGAPRDVPRPGDSIMPAYAWGDRALYGGFGDEDGYKVMRSADNGQTWSRPVRVTCESPALTSLAVNESGKGFLAWHPAVPGTVAERLENRPTCAPAPPRCTTDRVNRLRVKLCVPRECVTPGESFTATVTPARRRGRRVRKVVFRFDGNPVSVDERAPFRATIATDGAAPGARRLTAETKVSRRGARPRSERLTASVRIC